MAGCLDEPTALGFVRGELAEDEVRRTEEHLDACEECLGLIVELTRGDAPDDVVDAAPAPIRRGDPIGRYVVLELVGAGGMGVYAAILSMV